METATKVEIVEHKVELLEGQARLLADTSSDVLAAIAGCVGGDTLIETREGGYPIRELVGFHDILALTEEGIRSVPAFIFYKGEAQLYYLTLANGRKVEATANHYLLVTDGETVHWSSVGDLGRLLGYLPDPVESTEVSDQSIQLLGAGCFSHRGLDYRGHYSGDLYPYDGRLHREEDSDRQPSPLSICVLGYTHLNSEMDVWGTLPGHNHPYLSFSHLARNSLVPLPCHDSGEEYPVLPSAYELSQGLCQGPLPNHKCSSVAELPTALDGLFQPVSSSYDVSLLHLQSLLYHTKNRIVNIEPSTIASYYDMVVPEYHNYLAEGMIHHNTGGGKTMLGYWWLHNRMQTFKGFTWGVAEPTFNLLSKVLLTSSDPDRPSLEGYFKMVGHHPEYHAVDKILETDYGKIYLGSADNPDSMQGAAVKGYWLDEAGMMRLLAYETARQRCSMMNGQLLITTTPYDLGWLLSEIKNRSDKKGIHVETWRSIDRPGYPRDRYERERAVLPPWRFRMLYDAQFERPTGMIYSSFNESACVIDRFEIPKSWFIYVGHDFGPDNPSALFYAQDPSTGQFYLWHEFLPGAGISVYERVEAFKRITQGYHVLLRVGGAPSEEEIRQAYNAHGWVITQPKISHVEPQIDKVIGLHQLNKIMVFRDMVNYLDEKRTFSRQLDDLNKVTEKILNEQRYHLMAAERYILSNFVPETATGLTWDSNRSMRI